MKSVYIGVCKTRDDERFKNSFQNFTDSICKKYSVCQMIIRDTFLPDAQNIITKNFIQAGYDYLLFLDDDHWGHTPEMLDTLVNSHTYVSTIRTYSRHYPYSTVALYKEKNIMLPIEIAEGYVECDLTGFSMTLISRETFKFLEEPYFRPYEESGRNWNSDIDFFNRLAIKGIKPIVCFQHTLNHDKVTSENVRRLRYEERLSNNNLAHWRMLKDIESGNFAIK